MIRRLLWALWLLCLASPALCQPRGQYDGNDPIAIEEGQAYVFYRTNVRGALVLLREAGSGDDMAARPEPDRFVEIWWQPRFTSGGADGNSYFRALPPGRYVVYGNLMLGRDNIGMGMCLCMGSLSFEARPGQITDLGRIDFRRPDPASGRRPWAPDIVPYADTMALPARLAGLPRAPAEYRAAGKVPNYFGVEIDRHSALPGILAYERDRVIDARTGEPAPAVR
jgi:hypothetical protein